MALRAVRPALEGETTISTTKPPSEEQTEVVRPEPDEAPVDDSRPPHVADGVELIGEYEGSGFREAPYIARRSDGQVVQMPQILYLVAESIDGRRGYAEIGERVSGQVDRGLDAEGVKLLVEKKLRPLGIVAQADGSAPELQKLDPLLALKMKTGVVPERAVAAITSLFRPLYYPPVVAAVLAAFVALDVWLFFFHGVAQSLRQTLYDPLFILLLLGLVIVSAAFHECGHATACAYGGAKPGKMGVGLYIVWPAFYTDVTDAYRLGKGGRLRTDLGGVYFNSIFTLATFAAYFLTGWEPLLLVVPLQIMEMLHQFLPFIRLDGYYIVSDLTGVPDMFARIKPTLKSLNPAAETPDEVTALKPWVRVAVTVYVFTVVPLLLLLLGMTVINMPRIVSTAWDSFLLQKDELGHESVLATSVTVIQMLVLGLPIAGLFVTFWKLGQTLVVGGWRVTEGKPVRRGALVAATAVLAAGAAYIWLPNGDYRPIQPNERGTVQGGVAELASVPSGRPALTPERERELGGAPTKRSGKQRDSGKDSPAVQDNGKPASTTPTSTGETVTTTTTETNATTTTSTTPAATPTSTTETTTTDTTTTTATTTTTP
jgi:putative peptide zinc metalloprotease protein